MVFTVEYRRAGWAIVCECFTFIHAGPERTLSFSPKHNLAAQDLAGFTDCSLVLGGIKHHYGCACPCSTAGYRKLTIGHLLSISCNTHWPQTSLKANKSGVLTEKAVVGNGEYRGPLIVVHISSYFICFGSAVWLDLCTQSRCTRILIHIAL